MFWKRTRLALLASFFMATTANVVRAEEAKPVTAPATRTVSYKVLVPEYYETTRIVNKQQCVEEKYTAYKCENVKRRTHTHLQCKQDRERNEGRNPHCMRMG